ncbi:MAG: hypothetical protein U0625_11370 [Phycisphaerales bacterium]
MSSQEHSAGPSGSDATPGARSTDPAPGLRRSRNAAEDARSHRVLMTVLRSVFVVVLISVVVLTVSSNRTGALDFGYSTIIGLLLAAAALGLIVILVDALTPNKRLAWVVGIFVGTMLGLIGAVAVGSVIDLVASAWDLKEASVYLGLAKVTIGIVLVYLSISVVLTTRDDLRLVIPYVEFAKQTRGARPLLLDTSALVDGRIDDLARTGIIDAPVLVAQFVIDELQALADSGDRTKRQRGRRGLEMLQRLQGNPYIDLQVEDLRAEGRSVDRALVEVAKTERFRIVTTDTGLERVAQINGVASLNLNAVAGAMRPGQSMGDQLRVALVKKGENAGQAVGYLEDGTMVVVERAEALVGSTVEATIANTVQTAAGRLIFARLERGDGGGESATEPSPASTPTAEAGSPAAHDAGAEQERIASMARAATNQPRTPPRLGQNPAEHARPRNPRRER